MSSILRQSAWCVSKPQLLVSVAAAVLLAACSSGADRLSSNPADSDPVYTASVPKRVTAATAGQEDDVSSQPLGSASSEPPSYDYSKSYRTPQYRQPAVSAAPAVESPAEQTAQAGADTVTVGPGMTLYAIARANDVSVAQLAAANGIRPPYSVHTGQTLRLPATAGSGAASTWSEPETAAAAPAPVPAKPFKQGPSVADESASASHVVASGETLFSLGRKFGMSPFAIADANGLPHDAQLVTGQKVRIPGGKGAAPAVAAKKVAEPKLAAAAPPAEDTAGAAPQEQVQTKPAPIPPAAATASADVADPAPEESAAADASEGQGAMPAAVDGAPGMRWPVRGKVISAFGPKANGLKNEGINIAVPEGTSIRAADGGVVAYAGNELKGYGNLVLIRHDNGYVTAYAHAKELFVKRGDTVKRGDVIAKAGQTGSVSSPQLHFEVRKGATALDPIKFLTSATASN